MKGIPNGQIAALVRQDVEKVRQNAAVVIQLTQNGPAVTYGGRKNMAFVRKRKNHGPILVNNERSRLQVITVIGPGSYAKLNYSFKEAVLLEIGIGSSYPFREAKIPEDLQCQNRWCKGKASRIKRRYPLIRITREQYLAVAPILFAEMQKIVNRRIAARERVNHLNPPRKPIKKLFYSRRQNTVFNWDAKILMHPGSRFSVSAEDNFLLSDIYWLEQQVDTERNGRTDSLAYRIVKRLADYAKNGVVVDPERLKGFRDIDRFIEYANLPPYKLLEVLRIIKEHPRRKFVYERFRAELEKRLSNDAEATPEIRLIRQVLPRPEERLGVLRREELEDHLEEVARNFGWDDSLVELYRQRISTSPVWNRRYRILVTGELGEKDYVVFEMGHSLPTRISQENNEDEDSLDEPALA